MPVRGGWRTVADVAAPACQGVPLAGGSHGGQVGAAVRACPAGHLKAGYACDACRGTLSVARCLECAASQGSEGPCPAILIPGDAFRAAPFGTILARLRDMDTELAMASEVSGG
jgi:hypothetical protein